jgi:ribosomal protein S7
MKRPLGWLAVLCCLLTTARGVANEPRSVLKEAKKLIEQDKPAEALELYETAYENALNDPMGRKLPSSTLFRSWHKLGETYPPAMIALHEVRSRTIKSLLETGGAFNLMQDLRALNREFECELQTIDLFEQVVKAHPELAHRYWIIVKDDAIARERYDLASTYMPDLDLEFVKLKTSHELVTAMLKRQPANARVTKINEDSFVESVQQLILVGLKTGKPEVAAQVQKDALAIVDDPRIRNAIPAEAAKPAEKLPIAD